MTETKKEEPKQKIVLRLKNELLLDKNGKELKFGPDREPEYKQEDAIGLQSLINRYDSKKHPGAMKLVKALLNIKDKLEEVWRKDGEELGLSIDESSHLKEYLSKFMDLEGKDVTLKQFELRTLVDILEQLE